MKEGQVMKERYHVTGMTCSACSSHVEKAVSKLDGMGICLQKPWM